MELKSKLYKGQGEERKKKNMYNFTVLYIFTDLTFDT